MKLYLYIQDGNYCVSLTRERKKEFYANLNGKDITVNRKFWKTIKPLFSDKPKTKYTITLLENKNIAIINSKIVDLLNNFFRYCGVPDNSRISKHWQLFGAYI